MTLTVEPTETSSEQGVAPDGQRGFWAGIGAAILGLLIGTVVIVVMFLSAGSSARACAPPSVSIDPSTVPAGPVAGYGHDQLVNAALIAHVAASRELPQRAQLIGIMTAMGESGLINLDHGDNAHNPDGSVNCSLGLFQQQWCLGWGTREQVMDPAYAAGAFFDRLVNVPGWQNVPPTIAINRVQGNADPLHYAAYETAATDVLAAVSGAKVATCASGGAWQAPIDMATRGLRINDFFGMRSSSVLGYVYLHSGLDLGAASGTPVRAVGAGVVESVSTVDANDEGKNVRIRHTDGTETRYLHLSEVLVHQGETVNAGTVIGALGNTGLSTGAHLHLTALVDGNRVDPIAYLRSRGVDLCTLPVAPDATVASTCN